MFTKLKDFKNIRKSMHLFSNNEEGEELPGKQGKHLKSTASLPNKKSKGKRTQLPDYDSDVELENRTEDAAVGHDETGMEHSKKQKKSQGKRTQLPASDSDVEPDNRTEEATAGQDETRMEHSKKQKKSKGKRTPLPASNSDVEPDNRTEEPTGGQDGTTWIEHLKKQKKGKSKRTQLPASDSDVEPDNRTEETTAGQDRATWIEHLKKQKKSKAKRTQQLAFDSDVEPDHLAADAAAGQDSTWIEHPKKQQLTTQHPQHHDFVTSSSEASVPLSSSTQISSPSSARQSPLRRLKQAFSRSPTRHSESPSPNEEPPTLHQELPSDRREYDKFQPSAILRKFPKIRQTPGATTAATNPQGPPPALGSPSSALPVTREVMAGQGTREMPGLCQQGAGQQPATGNKKRPPPGAGFNPSKHRHTWPCEMIPINVPSPENAQAILHPRKDVFVLKVAKVSANGDRRIKMELELVTPKYGKKLPSRLDTREAQCDPECCCPCVCCPKPKKKKKC